MNNLWQTYLVKTDSAGNVKWDKSYGNNFTTCGAYINPTSDSGFIFASCTDSITSGVDDFTYSITKLDSIGNILWQNFYPHTDFHDVLIVREVPSGGYIFCGRIRDENINKKMVAWVMRLDETGNTIWERRYAHKNEFFSYDLAPAEFWDIQPTPDNGFIAVGKTFNQTQDFWVVKLDSIGCIGDYCGLTDTNCYYLPPCIEEDTVSVVEVEDIEKLISVYPNPASETIYISLHNTRYVIREIAITDISGKLILQTTQTEQSVSHLESGLYFVRVELTNGESAVRKVVIQ